MYEHQLNYLRAAVSSISSCTSPQLEYGGVRVACNRLRSPYVSRREIKYFLSESTESILRAWNTRHRVDVALRPVVYQPAGVPTGDGFVGEWWGVEVALEFVRPIVNLAEKFFGNLSPVPYPSVIQAWVLAPRLAGWYRECPVYYCAAGDNNEILTLNDTPAFTQGHLSVLPYEEPSRWSWTTWTTGRFFNHQLEQPELEQPEGPEGEGEEPEPVAVIHRGITACAVYLPVICDRKKITARDHRTVEVPAGTWVAVHPFPRRRDVD